MTKNRSPSRVVKLSGELVSPIVILGTELSSMDPFLYHVILGAGIAEALHVMVRESVWLTMNS